MKIVWFIIAALLTPAVPAQADLKACLNSLSTQDKIVPTVTHHGVKYYVLPSASSSAQNSLNPLILSSDLNFRKVCQNPGCICPNEKKCACKYKTEVRGRDLFLELTTDANGYAIISDPQTKAGEVVRTYSDCKHPMLIDPAIAEAVVKVISDSQRKRTSAVYPTILGLHDKTRSAPPNKNAMESSFKEFLTSIEKCSFLINDPAEIFCKSGLAVPRREAVALSTGTDVIVRTHYQFDQFIRDCKNLIMPIVDENWASATSSR